MSIGHNYKLNSRLEDLKQDIKGKQNGELKLRAPKNILGPKELHLLRKEWSRKRHATEVAVQINYTSWF